jgi:OmcA/MtrC family decaheme c-type cytochrome
MLRSYAIGDDFVVGTANAPGQPGSVNVTTSNTSCAGNVATTTIAADTVNATKGIIALQGKPWVVAVDPADADGVMQVRAKTPTYEYVVDTGAKATARRDIADTSACLKCHVGSMYQHGGNRVDNVSMCILCHNSASSDQNNRTLMKVDATEAYDGNVGQTYELKTMLHAIHAAGGDGQKGYVVYRTRGIYAFTPEGVLPPNWPTGPTECTSGQGPGHFVFGSDQAVSQSCQVHNLHHPTYPRAVSECAACHTSASFAYMPDQTKAVATTLDAGSTDWRNLDDDVLQGATSAACTSCHQSSAASGHDNQNGWVPSVFENGRQTIIDAAK